MQIPNNLVSGDNFRSGVVRKINDILTYLRTQRIVGDNRTIRVNQGVNGLMISAMQGGGGGGTSSSLNYPFKLSIGADEQDGTPQVCVHAGQINIQGNVQQQAVFIGYEYTPDWSEVEFQPYIPIDWEKVQDGQYYVFACAYDYFEQGADSPSTGGMCLVAPPDNIFVPFVPGFVSIPIGSVIKRTIEQGSSSAQQGEYVVQGQGQEQEEENKKYALTVSEQFVFGDMIIDDFGTSMPWGIRFILDWKGMDMVQERTGIVDQNTFRLDRVYLNNGRCYYSDQGVIIEDQGYTIKGENQNQNAQEGQDEGSNLVDGMYVAYLQNDAVHWTNDIDTLTVNNKCMVLAYFYIYNRLIYPTQCINNDLHFEGEGYPFKLYFDYDENDNQVLKIYSGQVFYLSDRFYLLNYNDDLITFDLAELEQGTYGIVGFVKQAQSANNNGYILTPEILIVSEDITTNDVPNIEGYKIFTIGAITKTLPQGSSSGSEGNNQGGSPGIVQGNSPQGQGDSSQEQPQPVYSIDYQVQIGNLILEDKYYDLPFTSICIFNDGDPHDVKTQRSDWVLDDVINKGGKVFDSINQAEQTLNKAYASDDSAVPAMGETVWAYLQRVYDYSNNEYTYQVKFTKTNPASTLWVKNQNGQLTTEKLVLCKVVNSTNIILQNYHPANFYFPVQDTYKVKVADNNNNLFTHTDYVAQYLDDKIKTDRAQNYASSTWPTSGGSPQSGYIYKSAVDGQNGAGSYMFLRWDYPAITNYANNKYLTLDCVSGLPTWQDQGKIRLTANDSSASFLPALVQAETPITITNNNGKLKWALQNFDYVQELVQGTCIDIQQSSGSSSQGLSGKTLTVSVDVDCVLSNLSITGTSPISVSKSGNSYNISFSSNVITSVVAGTCATASTSGGVATVGVDKSCVFSDFSITGDSKISVSGSGNSWHLSFTGGDSSSSSSSEIQITGTPPISVSQSGNTFNISLSLQGSGILVINNGTITPLPLPSGKAVLVSDNGNLSWVPYSTCENACSGSSSSQSALS